MATYLKNLEKLKENQKIMKKSWSILNGLKIDGIEVVISKFPQHLLENFFRLVISYKMQLVWSLYEEGEKSCSSDDVIR